MKVRIYEYVVVSVIEWIHSFWRKISKIPKVFCSFSTPMASYKATAIISEPIIRRQILDSSKLFAGDNSKFDKNGRKISKRVENAVGKGEIALYEQFLLFPQCFQKACFPGA